MDRVLTKLYIGGRGRKNFRGLGKCLDVIFLRPNSLGCPIDNRPALTPSEADVERMKVRFIRREMRPIIREIRTFAEVQDETNDGMLHYFT